MIFRYLYRRRLQRLAGAAIPPEKMKKLVATLGEWTALKLLLSGSVPEQAAGPDVPVWKQIGKNSGRIICRHPSEDPSAEPSDDDPS